MESSGSMGGPPVTDNHAVHVRESAPNRFVTWKRTPLRWPRGGLRRGSMTLWWISGGYGWSRGRRQEPLSLNHDLDHFVLGPGEMQMA